MKRFLTTLLIFLSSILVACGGGQKINGHTAQTAYRSVKTMKDRLPLENKVEFEVAFWTIRDANKSNDEFLDAVDGKTPWEIIDAGKEIYQQRKSSGFKAYEQYKSWEEMIAKFDKERIDQDKRPGSTKRDESRKNGTILYDLRAPQR